jgi:hypothetical protein
MTITLWHAMPGAGAVHPISFRRRSTCQALADSHLGAAAAFFSAAPVINVSHARRSCRAYWFAASTTLVPAEKGVIVSQYGRERHVGRRAPRRRLAAYMVNGRSRFNRSRAE